jgi:radical SAM superfamily enzyme YgiQ (UPF0313 family)
VRILLLNPPRFNGIPVIREERCEITERYSVLPPYSLLQIAGILRKSGHEVNLIDANGLDLDWSRTEALIERSSYDVLIFRFTPTTFDFDMRAAVISKRGHPKAFTAAICWTLRTMPSEVLAEAPALDFYIMHEYEVVSSGLLETLANGGSLEKVQGLAFRKNARTIVNSPADAISNYDALPLPAYDLLNSFGPYYINTPHGKPFTIMYASRGCPFACTFCTVRCTGSRKRSAESIMNELRHLKASYGIRTVSFFDETFTLDRERTLQLCDTLVKDELGIKWYCNTRVELVTRDLLLKMRQARCRGIAYGVESGSQQILDNVKKGNTVEDAEHAIKWTKEAGIKTYLSFILGLPGENWDTIRQTIGFVKRTRPTGAQFNLAVPYPGTPMRSLALERGWVESAFDWRQLYQHSANMRTEQLAKEDLEKARKIAYRSLYFSPRWLLGNVHWVLGHPEDFYVGARYFIKIMKNYLLYGMQSAH